MEETQKSKFTPSSPTSLGRKERIAPKQRRNGRDDRRPQGEDDGFETKIVKVRRVSRMYKGGRRMRLSIVVVVGDKKGRVGIGSGKGADIRSAQDKAVKKAKKNLIHVQLKGNTIPHFIEHKYKAARVILKPAAPGTGVVAGSSMRMVAEVVGLKDILGKIQGTNNPITNAYATIEALDKLRATRL